MNKISLKDEILAKARKELDKDILDFINESLQKEHPESFLIAVLHKVQEKYGYLSKDHLQAVAYLMNIPAAKVSGVASFYHLFHLKPKGKFVVSVCLGTACFVKGAEKLAKKFKEELGVDLGQTTTDGRFTLVNTRCLGMCAMAPVVKVAEDIHSKVTPDQVPALLEKYSQKS
ncbi:MAG: NADP-reducing hydrogenase subunit HndA [Candidatus Anoxychlamydiales bacterium]|nr:NADP-reducing hydrogenase subunit HndA [Candidatus Anoxychlamydiales bacterium]